MARPAPVRGPDIRVLIAEDHTVVREGIRMILDAQADVEVVGEARDGEEAVHLARQLRPDVVVMDISMPRKNGVEATQEIKRTFPDMQVLILTMHEEESYVFQLLRLGAAGYVLKRAAVTDLVEAVRAAARGEAFLYPAVARSVVQDYLGRRRTGEGTDRKSTRLHSRHP